MFQDTGRMIRFFEEKSGVPFPHPRYAQIVVPGDEAQEVSSFSVIGSENVEPILTNPKEDWAIVHELAHQWWGNLITCKSWDHFWLNEGMVVFLTAAYKEARWGKAEYDREMDVARKRYQVAKDQGYDLPLTKSQEPTQLKFRRAIAYSKAALFLDTLRKQMGETAFWSGLKDYSKKYAGKTVESKDFEKIMESKGGSEVTRLFSVWVN
jgi:aminopeptidase N